MAKIQFRIDSAGKVHIDVQDIQDASCEEITRAFEEALGIKESTTPKQQEYVELEYQKEYSS